MAARPSRSSCAVENRGGVREDLASSEIEKETTVTASASDVGRDGRRRFLLGAAGVWTVAVAGCRSSEPRGEESPEEDEGDEAEVTPGEDLMQEHGLLERVLLVYQESA